MIEIEEQIRRIYLVRGYRKLNYSNEQIAWMLGLKIGIVEGICAAIDNLGRAIVWIRRRERK